MSGLENSVDQAQEHTLHCPACGHALTKTIANGIKVDTCQGGCGGVWFDNFELDKLSDPLLPIDDSLIKIPVNPLIQVDYGVKRPCPRCPDVMLKRRFSSRTRQVQIDECGGCGGIWLDAGELGKIRQEMSAALLLATAPTLSLLQYLR